MSRPEEPDDVKRPSSARDLMGGGRSSGRGGGAEPPRSEPEEKKEGQRPTPVREMMAPDVGLAAAGWERPSRVFEHRGEEWVVILAGQTVTGSPSDPGAPLMELHFAPAEDPGNPRRELLCVGRGLDHLFDEELRQYLDRARPYRGGPSSP